MDSMFKDYLSQLFVNGIDAAVTVAIPMLIAIFAFAFPLLVQVASRIDDKYRSTLLIKAFYKDKDCRCFIFAMIISLFCCLLWMLQIPRTCDFGLLGNIIVERSAAILLVFSVSVLVLRTIWTMKLIYVFYIPEELFKRLELRYNGTEKEEKEYYFEAISKILFYSMRTEGESLARDLQGFYTREFIRCREAETRPFVTYPDYFYNVFFDANEVLCQRVNKSISWYDSSFYHLFIDEIQDKLISEDTYRFLWRCLCQSILYGKDEFVVSYWGRAHQYMDFYLLQSIPLQYDEQFNVINKDEVDLREKAKKRFQEFHYALGGFIMKTGNYSLLYELMCYTNQSPPKYVLVPESMEEVVERFIDLGNDITQRDIVYYERKYPFPDVSGVSADATIRLWIRRYLSILFLRQYTLPEFLSINPRLAMPNPPQGLAEMKKWRNELDILGKYVSDLLADKDCLVMLGLAELSDFDCFKNMGKPRPEDLISSLKEKLKESAELVKKEQGLDQAKISQFEEATKSVLNTSFDKYIDFEQSGEENQDSQKLYFGGHYQLMEKMAFGDNQEVSYVNFDSIIAELVVRKFELNFPMIFAQKYDRITYRLSPKDIFFVVDKLGVNQNEYSIVAIGLNLEWLKYITQNDSLIMEAGQWKYKGTKIIELGDAYADILNQSLFILKKDDLPKIKYSDLSDEIKLKYELKEIENKRHIYTSVIDLNQNNDVREEVVKRNDVENDLSKSVLVCVDVNVEVSARMSAKCLQIKVFSLFDDQGNPNDVSEVKSIW